jgi:hypothetical protein
MPEIWRIDCEDASPQVEPDGGYRYPIQLGLRGQVRAPGLAPATIRGQTIEISARRLSFWVDGRLLLHSHVDLYLTWPVRSGENEPLELHILGEVVQCSEGFAVCRILRHALRLARAESEGTLR